MSTVSVETHRLSLTADGTASTVQLAARALSSDDMVAMNAGAAAATGGPGSRGAAAYVGLPGGVTLVPPTYSVVVTDTLTPVDAGAHPTYSAADERRQALGSGVEVVPTSDVYAPTEPPVPPDIDPTGYYLLTACHSGKNLEVRGDALDDGAAVQQWAAHSHGNQYWRFIPLGDGTHMIVSEHSGKVLDATGYGTANGTPIQQWTPLRGPNQRWRVVRVQPGRYRIESIGGGRCLDVAGGEGAIQDGAPVQLWDWWGGLNQTWQLTVVRLAKVLHQRIDEQAYARWLGRGRPLWQADIDWSAAEHDVLLPILRLEAYVRYEQRGRQGSHALDDWLTAERDVRAQLAAAAGANQ
jgi:hypothetical protein